MKKCPYCGTENEGSVCKKCKAAIPVSEPKEKKSQGKPVTDKKKE